MSSLSKYMLTVASVLAGAATVPAMAQSAGTEATLEEVVVTAEKREVNLQSLAQTVTAISGDSLIQQGVKDITDLSRVAPEVNIIPGNMNNVTIRGIRTNSFGPTLDSANAVYVDGNYNARFTSLNGLFFDIQRVEVLDGPQGTLYGRNSAGGAINVITNRPSSEFGGNGTVEVGNYNALLLTGALNLPLSTTTAARLSYYRSSRLGFYKDTGLNDQNLESWRAQFQWKPTDNDTFLISAYASKLGGKGNGASTLDQVLKNPTILTNTTTNTIVAYNGACPAGNTCTPAVVSIRATDDPWHNAVLYGDANLTYAGVRNDAFALQYDHSFNFATLTFQASRMSNYAKNGGGTSSGLQQDPRLVAAQLFFNTAYSSPASVDDTWNSQELRLTSTSTRPLQWVVGLYRFHESGGGANATYVRPSETRTTVASSPVGSFIFPATQTIAQDIPNVLNETTAQAVFGQATWTPSGFDRLHLTAGARYNEDKKHGVLYIYPQAGPISVGAFGGNGLFDQSKSWTSTTYKANVAFDLTDHNMIYVDRSTGFQSGGYGYGSSPAYEPTKIGAWEIGSKNRFLDNKLQVNVSAWDYKYTNQTQNISDVFLVNFAGGSCPGPGCVPFNFITVANAGSTRVKGQSLDIQLQATQNDRLSLNVQHIDGKFENFDLTQRYTANAVRFGTTFAQLNPGYSPTGDQSGPSYNYNGTQVGATPKVGILASYQHVFHGGGFDYTPMVYYHYNGEMRAGNNVAPNMPPADSFWTLPAWSTADVSLSIGPSDGKYDITLWSRNVTDKLYVTGRGYSANSAALSPAAALYAYTTVQYGAPRTFGATFSAKF